MDKRHRQADRGHLDQVGDQPRVERTAASASGTGATIIDWGNLIECLHLFERVGAERYNKLNTEHLKQQTVATLNGHAIPPGRTSQISAERYSVTKILLPCVVLSHNR